MNDTQNSTAKHPKGLYVLFFTEMWERFGYYLMLGIFSLYMLDSVDNGGMGFDMVKKSDIYGTYLGLVYLTPFLGGLLADRVFGFRKSIVAGGLLMAAGYLGLALPGEGAFYISLLLIILGNGFFKPNISTLVGNLYDDDKFRANKDAGYNIFYMGINIGAFVCNFVAAYMRINYGWGWAFGAAGVGMLIGVVIFLAGTKHVKHADVMKPVQKEDMSLGKIFSYVLLPVFICGIIGYVVPEKLFDHALLQTKQNDAFIFGCIPVLIFYGSLWTRASKEDKNPIGALLSVMFCVIIFWAVFHQNGDALTVWAKEHTDREMPEAVAAVAQKANMAQVVTYDPANTHGTYFENLPEAKRPEPGKSLLLFSTELYQSINPFWVVLLTPVVVGLWGFLRKRKAEPSTPAKIALGMLITGLSTLVMVAAVSSISMGDEKASSWWLIASYGVITFGELCLSPMGLSLVSKLSPPRLTALMMGGWFLSTAVGNKLSGMLSGLWEGFENKSNFFLMNFGLCIAATILLLVLLKWLRKVMAEKNIH
ncbi:MAG: peptide MFS transporter [Chitinophagales bacterium]|nr:peptide MFS transporter [Chitinophagaceae bacterium]MCB9065128.1 peptide MFS transporter [Chitinophagales bacterium]